MLDSLTSLTKVERQLVQHIKAETKKRNVDNISRTEAYLEFYQAFQEIDWSFLAHMVSRNAGYNICDLEGRWFPHLLDAKTRRTLFLTYEKANWLIFQDAYPQLLLYRYSIEKEKPLFHLLKYFHVSLFMEKEWNRFWINKGRKRLLYSLIINEQNVVQHPVIHHPFYQRNVFRSARFCFQDWFHFSSVLLPTCNGMLFGASVSGFKYVNKRIELGKKIAKILFDHSVFPLVYEFAIKTVHTGSRYDYERYFMRRKSRDTPLLRMSFPIVRHHIHHFEDWSLKIRIRRKWFDEPSLKEPIILKDWFEKKQKQLHKIIQVKQILLE
ncbi:DUF2515 family protein [Niallia sp. Krafla_26]|uniref:DUF2515 family protein n=1 Tax=Niallia sp. Krafla_26 TaxID=3064703 RepID=UPI003D16E817